ncbi:hypothetical protein L873DRAFT_1803270 [Choiromyces venosus 120613-1]|uniref:Uncharacterized protein n=1 Tax=Choiromyces venosus 120613-1 TaxID=1336337 RepID=A0A3N4JT78_9PEZI|nr:hypothetical protein L873DRAFT_1803270 [Choiromyces venosus 120613-1]
MSNDAYIDTDIEMEDAFRVEEQTPTTSTNTNTAPTPAADTTTRSHPPAPTSTTPPPTTPGKPAPWICCICQHGHFTTDESPLRQCPTPDCTHTRCTSCLSFWQCCTCGASWEIGGPGRARICWDCGHPRCTRGGHQGGCYVNFALSQRVEKLRVERD